MLVHPQIVHRRLSRVLLAATVLLATACGDSSDSTVVTADDIAVAYTPEGGYGDVMPPPILARCTEPLVDEAPDLRGLWQTETLTIGGTTAPPEHNLWRHVERVEQCGNRVVVTSTGVIHDMRADGTVENGVHDVSAIDFRPIQVVATFEERVLVLRPVGIPGIEVTRARDGAAMVWHYGPATVVRMARIDEFNEGARAPSLHAAKPHEASHPALAPLGRAARGLESAS